MTNILGPYGASGMYRVEPTQNSVTLSGGTESIWANLFYNGGGEFALHYLVTGNDEYDESISGTREDLPRLFQERGLPVPDQTLIDELVLRAREFTRERIHDEGMYGVDTFGDGKWKCWGGTGSYIQETRFHPETLSFSVAFTEDDWETYEEIDGITSRLDLFRTFRLIGFPPPGDDQLDRLILQTRENQ